MKTLSAQYFRFAEFELDGTKRLLLKHGQPVPLNSKTFDLLLALVENRGEVLGRDQLLERVWNGQFVEEGNLTVQISALRKIFGERKDEHRFIVTVPGRGYSFVAELEGTNGDFIVESHSLSRIVVEEELKEAPDRPDGRHLALLAAGRKNRSNLFAAAVIGVLLALGFGYWLYRQNTSTNFAAGWITPKVALKPQQLTTNGKVAFAALSPDGDHFAYTVGQTDKPSLWYANTNGKQQLQIRPPEAGISYKGLTFAPDGNEIYYVADDDKNRQGGLFRIPVLGSTPPHRVLANIDSPVTFSPDGKQVAFIRNVSKRKLSILVVADTADGANERELASRPLGKHFTVRGLSWSPDGKHIAAGAIIGNPLSEEAVVLVNTENGAAEKFGSATFNQVRRVAWLKDGSGLYVNAIEKDVWDDRHLWLIEFPAGKAHKVTQDLFHYGMFNLSVSDDGSKVLSVSSTKICNIFVSPSDNLTQGNKITANSLGKLAGAVGMTWADDGKIVYSTFFDKGQTLWVMNADGSNARQLTPPGFLDRLPSASKDTVVFGSSRGTEGGLTIWRTGLDGGEMKQLAIGNRPSITPDGRWVLYGTLSDEGFISVYKVSIDGGDQVRLTHKPSGYVRVSPDGKTFACSYNTAEGEKNQLAVVSIDGGEPLHVFDVVPGANLGVGIRWMPDGRSLVYRDFGPSLWKQDLSGAQPEKILEFPDEIIYSFDWSPNGKHFAIAHGEDVRDVVLVTSDR
jgi:DNA-binding winged helix-turn-helix (wHTH) protein/Tol biopolymer transport system component